MPRFEPFVGIRYDTGRVDLAAVTAPPYDVIDADQRAELAARSPYNAVRVDLPVDEGRGDPYAGAAATFADWQHEGLLISDPAPSLYRYRMSFTDEEGRAHRTTGVIGALGLEAPGEGDVLPHEQTTPKARSDRLQLLRATAANTSVIWTMSLYEGLSGLLEPPDDPIGEWADDDGVVHALWRVANPDAIESICAAVASSPVVIADGHHRYDTCLAYRDECRGVAATDDPAGRAGAHDLTLAFVVELVEDQLTVLPIHRLVRGLPPGLDLDLGPGLARFFTVGDEVPVDDGLSARLAAGEGPILVQQDRARLLHPRPEALAGADDLDTSRLDTALASLPDHDVTFQHGVDNVLRAVATHEADAGVLMRPVPVAQIAAAAHQRERMPPKTTFFWPKLRTGQVFRSLG